MTLRGSIAAVTGPRELAEPLSRALKDAGAKVSAEGPLDYLFHVCAPDASLREDQLGKVLARVDESGPRLKRVCLLRDPRAPEPSGSDEARALALEDGLRYLARLHGVPVSELPMERALEPLDPEALS